MFEGIRVSLIVAVAENGVIGNKGELPWKISQDMQRFRELTLGKPLIVGRKTNDSFPAPLKYRRTIVLTKNEPEFQDLPMSPAYASCPERALHLSRLFCLWTSGDEIMIGGGAEIYKIFEPWTDRAYVTTVHDSPPGDTFWDKANFTWPTWDIAKDKHISTNPEAYSFQTWEKKQ